ncbi:GNAT family N-acetyltransferase [Spiribacter vilamensis]|uniref:Acetyltransferase (GNAT) family protein n=1 Tax=Spiribacter vilamensis TaxID=531306 RepID=A0A4Q8D1H9_9GAMM|nr:GNAT family N-acetyltransferase [Spiribacter vilamensis]RZU99162.1 acetyltransferase (GNAT) family protein [Spiribacter vilamensis]TVO61847.1 GNAT family N-acetyltransferase [Spiribacter vilamensis]
MSQDEDGSQQELEIRQINSDDNTKSLSLGDPEFTPLKAFLKNEAADFHRRNVAKSYVAVDESHRVRGYITLICSQVQIAQAHHRPEGNKGPIAYKSLPSIKVARLATDKRYQGSGLGRSLLDLALAIALGDIMPAVGCRFLVVDAKKPSVGFYLKYGFTPIQENYEDEDSPVLFLDLHPFV